jgi:hypothetical protein
VSDRLAAARVLQHRGMVDRNETGKVLRKKLVEK